MLVLISRVYLLIIKFIAIIQEPTKWVFYAWIYLKQNIVFFTMVWLHGILYLIHLKLTYLFQCSKSGYEIFIYRKILERCWAPLWLHFFFDIHASAVFQSVIVLGFEYCTVQFPIITFVFIIRIIRNVIVVLYVLLNETMIVRLFQCN